MTPYCAKLASYGQESKQDVAPHMSVLTPAERREVAILRYQQAAYLRALADLAPVIAAARLAAAWGDQHVRQLAESAPCECEHCNLRAALAAYDKAEKG